jgi:hypothetical protein
LTAKRFGGQQVGPEALVVEDLVRLDERRAGPGRGERARGEERRSALAGETDIEVAAEQARRRARPNAMGANRVAVGRPPHRVVIADPAAELGQLRVATHLVVVQPAVGTFKFLA